MGKEKITLSICTNRGIKSKTLGCILEMVNYSKVDWHFVIADRGYTVADNRNYSVIQAQKNGSDYLLFIDDDMIFPSYTLENLLEHKKDVVGINSYSRCLPLSSTVGLMNDKGEYMRPEKHTSFELRIPKELFRAYFVGCGVCLIDMKVFNKIEKPYFEFTFEKEGNVKDGEDGLFCKKVREAGMDVWCDGTLEIFHIGDYEYGKVEEPLVINGSEVEKIRNEQSI